MFKVSSMPDRRSYVSIALLTVVTLLPSALLAQDPDVVANAARDLMQAMCADGPSIPQQSETEMTLGEVATPHRMNGAVHAVCTGQYISPEKLSATLNLAADRQRIDVNVNRSGSLALLVYYREGWSFIKRRLTLTITTIQNPSLASVENQRHQGLAYHPLGLVV